MTGSHSPAPQAHTGGGEMVCVEWRPVVGGLDPLLYACAHRR
jgi:hypothetical protein